MSLEVLNIKGLDLKNNKVINLNLELFESDEEDVVSISIYHDNKEIKKKGEYWFLVFQELKDLLLDKYIGLQCYGSLINVYPSPMMMNMGGQKAYFLKIGKPSLNKDIVNIFDYIDIYEFATKEQQDQFYNKWLNSIMNK